MAEIPKPHTFHYVDEIGPDGRTIRHAVLDEPARFHREMLRSALLEREMKLEDELSDVRRRIREMDE